MTDRRDIEVYEPQFSNQTGAVERPEGDTRRWTYSPAVDIIDCEDAYVLEADLPGADRERIDLSVDDGILSIEAPAVPRQPGRERVCRHEYGVGDFHRRFRLDRSIDVAKIDATYDMGVLTVRLPKADEARPRKIEIA